jgi:UDP-N-acetylglucosamine--N-acetylmuramyl-(pentapeptide) pyrophosphoryl-undecaprenol N-acetylglucosamine transferase
LKKIRTYNPSKRIVLTGGGTAGHVIPNLALLSALRQKGWGISYLGSKHGIEKTLLSTKDISYFAIPTGKLRRYISWQNFIDFFNFLFGIIEAQRLLKRINPSIVFSKGGFVALPVVLGAWLNRIPIIIHESDLTPGLANRLSFPFAKKICLTFADTKKFFSNKDKVLVTGTPIRNELFQGNAILGRKICNFTDDKKIILVQGGGLGSDAVNKLIRNLLPKLLPNFNIVHSCGKGKVDNNLQKITGYCQFEYISTELPHVLAAADLVISRAGANSIYELLSLKKLHILLPLSKEVSRGDQLKNAKYCEDLGFSHIIYPQNLKEETLLQEIDWIFDHADPLKKAMMTFNQLDSIALICDLLSEIKK